MIPLFLKHEILRKLVTSILSVSLLHSAVTSRPSYLAGKGAELWIQKAQTYTTM